MSRDSTGGETLLLPQESTPSTPRFTSHALPTDLLERGARRLRVLALLYAFVFFMAGFFPPLLFPDDRAFIFGHVVNWLPGVLSIAAALAVAEVARRSRLPVATLSLVGTVFEVVSSYGIAAAEFLSPRILMFGSFVGLSWVAVWVSLFTIVVPTSPRRALVAALASTSAVPVVIWLEVTLYPPAGVPSLFRLFFAFVFPYLLVTLMVYVSSRVMFALGTEVRRARELGSYRLTERLGQGGMGEVWRASHRLLARPAAIKLIRPVPANPADTTAPLITDAARRRFEREAQNIARLRSPHTVNLFDFGVADDGAFYYVMELLEGLDAERLVRRFGPQPAERVIHLLRQMCHSLSEAESIGLVHRDIKPANIFLCRYGEDYDFIKILDFGIAKAVQDRDTGVEPTITSLTVEQVIHGTPAFIAPEQAMGGTVDGRADIYATGCVAYWLLTGELVFNADTPMRLMMHHAHTAPAAPSARTELPIPAALDALILSCLAKDPAGRPQSARDLSRRLGDITSAAPWTEERARQWWQEHLAS